MLEERAADEWSRGRLEPIDIEARFAHRPPAEAFASLEAQLSALSEAEQSEARAQALKRLETLIEGRPFSCDWLAAVFAASPAYLRGQGCLDHPGSLEDGLCRLVASILRPAMQGERAACMAAILPDLGDISLFCAVLRKGADDLSPEAWFGSATAALKTSLCARIEKLAAQGGLWRQASPGAILWLWWAASQEDRVYAFVKASMSVPQGLAALLDMVVEPAAPKSGGAPVIAVRRWSKLVEFQSLEKHALDLALNGASREGRRRARRFLDAFGNGKSELFR